MNYFIKEWETKKSLNIRNLLPEIGIDSARQEILAGLQHRPKYILPKYFYNSEGSALFEEITRLDEYYLTRSEKEILSGLIEQSPFDLNFENLDIIELGSGDTAKISLIFNQLSPLILETVHYIAVDIARSALEKSIQQLTDTYQVDCTGIITDFYHHLKLEPVDRKRLFCFFGSTIGNFDPDQAQLFLQQLGAIMEKGDALLLGADLVKDVAIIERAYNDKRNITEAFNKNILNTVNTLLETRFNPADFKHVAFYNVEQSRIEMHLQALQDVHINSKYGSGIITINKGETLHTENSYKFNKHQLEQFGRMAGCQLEHIFFDSQKYFGLSYYLKY